MLERARGEADALVGHTIAGGGIEVDADQAGQLDLPGGFFEGFAQCGVEQAFVGLEVAGGLVEYVLAGLELLDHEEAALVFDEGGDGDVGLPGHVLDPWVISRALSLASQLPQDHR
ncbi:hypothetical protein D3C80_1834860 [compost metagenome]